jgi:hypothetical protein
MSLLMVQKYVQQQLKLPIFMLPQFQQSIKVLEPDYFGRQQAQMLVK